MLGTAQRVSAKLSLTRTCTGRLLDNVSAKLDAVAALGPLLELDHRRLVVAQLLDAGRQVCVADALAEGPPAASWLG